MIGDVIPAHSGEIELRATWADIPSDATKCASSATLHPTPVTLSAATVNSFGASSQAQRWYVLEVRATPSAPCWR
ncbi:MAG: hypothetical protein R2856_20595 [Caldilineaceae bacterium]